MSLTKKKPLLEREKQPLQKRSIEIKRRIIETAKELFAIHGFDATTINMISQQADVSVSSIYAQFEDKRHLFLFILHQHSEESYQFSRQSLNKVLEEMQNLDEAIDRIIPILYKANKLEGKLNHEMYRFALMDKKGERNI